MSLSITRLHSSTRGRSLVSATSRSNYQYWYCLRFVALWHDTRLRRLSVRKSKRLTAITNCNKTSISNCAGLMAWKPWGLFIADKTQQLSLTTVYYDTNISDSSLSALTGFRSWDFSKTWNLPSALWATKDIVTDIFNELWVKGKDGELQEEWNNRIRSYVVNATLSRPQTQSSTQNRKSFAKIAFLFVWKDLGEIESYYRACLWDDLQGAYWSSFSTGA